MFNNNKEFKNKISSILKNQLPDFIQVDHPIYVEFVKKYFEYLESSQLFITGTNNYLNQETNSFTLVLDENGRKIILEDSNAVFVKNELIRGQTSNATARVILSDYDVSGKLHITSNQSFIVGERIVGETSDANAIITSYLANPIQSIQQFLLLTDVDNTLNSLVIKFRDMLLESFPTLLADGLAKQNLIKNVRDLYNTKGTAAAHQLFFRAILNEPSEIFYPSDRMLRASAGQWSSDTIIRVIENNNSIFSNLVGQRIYTLNTSGNIVSSAIISNVISFRERNFVISELTIDNESVVGTFDADEVIYGIDPTIDQQISATIKSIVKNIDVVDTGFYYTENDDVFIEKIGNESSIAFVDNVGTGQIDEVLILDGGRDYAIGEDLVFDNLNTNGVGADGKISIVGGSFLLEDATLLDSDSIDYSLLIDSDGDFIIYEDNDYIKLELPRNQNNLLLSETAENIIIEPETFNDIASYDIIANGGVQHPHYDSMGYWSASISDEAGEITKIILSDRGVGYKTLPTVSVTTVNGTNAELIPLSTKSPGVGHVTNVQLANFGLEYNTAPDVNLQRNVVVKNVQGSFANGDELISHTGTVIDYSATYSMLKINTNEVFSSGDRIVSVTGASAYVHFSKPATIQSSVGTIAQTSGKYISDKSKISNVSIRLQDSYYYQDFSYVVKVAQSINEWRNAVKRSVHPAGWNLFGEVVISDFVSGSITRITNKFLTGAPSTEFSPIIFGSLFGRRLGTIYQGVVREEPNRSVIGLDNLRKEGILFEDNGRIVLENEPGFIKNEKKLREVTLSSNVTVRAKNNRPAIAKGYGHLANLPIYAFVTPRMNSDEIASNWYGLHRTKSITELNKHIVDGEYYTISQFATTKIIDVSDSGYLLFDEGLSGDGDKIVLEDSIDADSGFIFSKTNFPITPHYWFRIQTSGGLFSTTILWNGFIILSTTDDSFFQQGYYQPDSSTKYILGTEDGGEGSGYYSNRKITFSLSNGFLKNEFIGIPATAYSKNINVPPPAEIILSNAPRETLMDAYNENEENQTFWTAKFSEIGITWDRDDFTFDDSTLTTITVNLTSTVVKSGFVRGISLANLPIYAFVTPRMDTNDVASNWYGINRTISNSDVVDGEYYTISQFGRFKINETSVHSNVLQENNDLINLERGSQDSIDSFETNINTFDSNVTFDSGTEYISDEEYKIPNNAYKKVVKVPPPGEIVLTTV